MGASYTPDQLMEIPNIWYEFSTILNTAESDYTRDKGKK